MHKYVKILAVAGMVAAVGLTAGCGGGSSAKKDLSYTKATQGLEVVPAAEASFKKNCAQFDKITKWVVTNQVDTKKRDEMLKKTGVFAYTFKGTTPEHGKEIKKDGGRKDTERHEVNYVVTICPHKVVVMENYTKIDKGPKDDVATQDMKTISSKEANNFLNTTTRDKGKQVKACKHNGKIVKFDEPLK